MENWDIADRISDKIVALINEEIDQMARDNIKDPVQILAGQLLALLAVMKTWPPHGVPLSGEGLRSSIHACLDNILNNNVSH